MGAGARGGPSLPTGRRPAVTVYALALLARLAGAAGQAERAGRLWGAIEAEEARGPVGYWEGDRERIASTVVISSTEFESARSAGRSLSLDEAVAYALGDDRGSLVLVTPGA